MSFVSPAKNSGDQTQISHHSKSSSLAITFAVGIIVALGGVFLILASRQILPQGINAISQFQLPGQVISAAACGIGVIILAVACIKCARNRTREGSFQLVETKEEEEFWTSEKTEEIIKTAQAKVDLFNSAYIIGLPTKTYIINNPQDEINMLKEWFEDINGKHAILRVDAESEGNFPLITPSTSDNKKRFCDLCLELFEIVEWRKENKVQTFLIPKEQTKTIVHPSWNITYMNGVKELFVLNYDNLPKNNGTLTYTNGRRLNCPKNLMGRRTYPDNRTEMGYFDIFSRKKID